MTERLCAACGETKPLTAFYSGRNRDGSTSPRGACKACRSARAKARAQADPSTKKARQAAYYQANRERLVAQEMKRQRADPAAYKARQADYYRRNAEVVKEKVKAWQAANPRQRDPEKKRAAKRRYYLKHREEILAKQRERHEADKPRFNLEARLRYKNYPESFIAGVLLRLERLKAAWRAPVSRKAIYERDRGICQICREPVAREDAALDHIIPISRGGEHAPWNVQLAHRVCNKRRFTGRGFPAQTRLPM